MKRKQSGELGEGYSLPSERTLADALRLSRELSGVVTMNYVSRYISTHGRAGVMVKAPPRINPELGKLKGFTEEMHDIGVEPSTQLWNVRSCLTVRLLRYSIALHLPVF